MKNHRNNNILTLRENLPEHAGGKALGLARMAQSGLRVPDAFVILGDCRDAEALKKAYEQLGGGTVAVRSSGAAEDGVEFSAAGQFETFLGVEGMDALHDAVEKCFASARNERVQSYQKELSGVEDAPMSVVVQKMIEPEKAGVLFTVDPVNGYTQRMVVEAVEGLGESLVSGERRGEQHSVCKITGESKEVENGRNLLKQEELKVLTEQSLKAEEIWGHPLDLEWAIDSRGELHWLQARPITTLDKTSLDSRLTGPDELITRANIGEMFPGAATPLTVSVFGECLDWGMWQMYLKCGAVRRRDPRPVYINCFENQFFMNFTSMYSIGRRVAGASGPQIEMNILGRVLGDQEYGENAPALVRAFNGLKYFSYVLSHKSSLRKITRIAHTLKFQTETEDIDALLRELDCRQEKELNRAFYCHYNASSYSGIMNTILATILGGGKEPTQEGIHKMTDLLINIEGIESVNVIKSLDEIVQEINSRGDLETFQERDCSSALKWLNSESSGHAGELFSLFLKRHGHRAVRESELREPEWAETPETVVQSLKEMAAVFHSRPQLSSRQESSEPRKKHKGAEGYFIKKAKQGVREREFSKSMLILTLHKFKVAYRRLGQLLEKKGILPERDLLYFLTRKEVESLWHNGDSEKWIELAQKRREDFPRQMKIQFPELAWGVPKEEIPEDWNSGEGKIFRGTPVSKGIVTGPVRIVTSLEEAHKLTSEEIMVASFTDIGWTPFYGVAAGLITELGGALSHGAVVAREYGLPLVTNIANATKILKTGQTIRMDGSSGIITLIE